MGAPLAGWEQPRYQDVGKKRDLGLLQEASEPPDVREFAPSTQAGVAHGIARSLAKNPNERWQSIADAVRASSGNLP